MEEDANKTTWADWVFPLLIALALLRLILLTMAGR